MTSVFDASNVLMVFLSDNNLEEKKPFTPKGCHQLNLHELIEGRQTILSRVLNYSNELMDTNGLTYMDVIFVDQNEVYTEDTYKNVCAQLKEAAFVSQSGFRAKGNMGLYFDAGELLKFSDVTQKLIQEVDIPSLPLSAFRHYNGISTRFLIYDKWNSNKYLDLELAFFAKERGQNFRLNDVNNYDWHTVEFDAAKDKIHKAAIYNELFVKNSFEIKNVHHSSASAGAHGNVRLEKSLETINSHRTEIEKSNNKLNYINSKVGNFDALEYNIQENVNTSRIRNLFQMTKAKSDEHVIFSLASIPEREDFLQQTINSIYKQCDQIFVYLNGYEMIPAFLDDQKITVYRSQDHGDLSANGKVWFLNEERPEGYVFLIDDDIIYPKDYVSSMIATLQKYQHRFAACVHGSIFSDQLRWYYQRSAMFPFKRALVHDAIVNLPGSGTFAFHTSTLDVSYADFAPFTMVDLILGITCKNQSVPIVSVARCNDWLKVQKDESGRDLWSSFKSVITLHTPTVLANGPWILTLLRPMFCRI